MNRFVLMFVTFVLYFMVSDKICYAINPAFELNPSHIQGNYKSETAKKKSAHKLARFKKNKMSHRKQLRLNVSRQTLYLSAAQNINDNKSLDQRRISAFWEQLVPETTEEYRPFESRTSMYDLALDPEKYPQIIAKNGKRLVLDRQNSLPSLVKTLIQQQNSDVVVVSGSKNNDHDFIRNLLDAGEFFSVEEHAAISFGNDPRLKVISDFKIERTAESVMKDEVIIVSASSNKYPDSLRQHLDKHGVTVLEPLAYILPPQVIARNKLLIAPAGKRDTRTVLAVLENLVQDVVPNKRIELYQAADSGIKLSVNAGYYFEFRGQSYIVSSFSNDPVAFTLLRLLETKGYKVIFTEETDDFKGVVSKILKRMDLDHVYAPQRLITDPDGKYSIELSGFVVDGVLPGNGKLVLTDRLPEDDIISIIRQHGFQVEETVLNVK